MEAGDAGAVAEAGPTRLMRASVGDLRKHAAALGAAKGEIDAALDADDRKQALLSLIDAKEGGGSRAVEEASAPPTAAPSTTTVVTFAKGADGFGFRMSKAGTINGYTVDNSAAALSSGHRGRERHRGRRAPADLTKDS